MVAPRYREGTYVGQAGFGIAIWTRHGPIVGVGDGA